jgi:flagella basal body P-ring formation protein FlgA
MNRLAAMAAMLVLGGTAHAQTTVVLRSRAETARPGEALLLAHVAAIEGPAADNLGRIVLADAGEKPAAIRVEDVRRAIDVSGAVSPHAYVLRGLACELGDRPPASAAPRTPALPDEPQPQGAASLSTRTVRGLIAARLADALHVPAPDLRLTFAPRDAALLDAETVGRTVDVRILGLSDRVPVRVTVYREGRIELSGTTRVGVEARRTVVVARTDRRRGERIAQADVEVQTRWMPWSLRPVAPAAAGGSALRNHARAGEPILEQDVEAPIVARRGQVIALHCATGAVVLAMQARLTADARDGEVVELETLEADRRARRRIMARMSGPGSAVVVDTPGPFDRSAQGATP